MRPAGGLPSHTKLSVSVRLWAIDSWDNELAFVSLSGVRVFAESAHYGSCEGVWNAYNGSFAAKSSYCGCCCSVGSNCYTDVTATIAHTDSSVVVVIGAEINQPIDGPSLPSCKAALYAK